MEHVVFFPTHDGTPAFRRVASLDDAVLLVEHLRNVEQVDDVTVHALTDVPLAFRAYYRVEVAAPEAAALPVEEPAAEAVVEAAAEAPAERVSDAELPPLVTVGQRNGAPADVRGLGFFAS